jgi:hypothetical protein
MLSQLRFGKITNAIGLFFKAEASTTQRALAVVEVSKALEGKALDDPLIQPLSKPVGYVAGNGQATPEFIIATATSVEDLENYDQVFSHLNKRWDAKNRDLPLSQLPTYIQQHKDKQEGLYASFIA